MSESQKEALWSIAQRCGAVAWSPPPFREVKGVSFTYEQLDSFAKKILLPWRTPSERPEHGRECFFKYLAYSGPPHSGLGVTTEREPDSFYAENEDFISFEHVFCWCYVDELSLPEWVQK